MNNKNQFDVSVTCSRDSNDRFTMRVRDVGAVNAAIEITMTPQQFAYMISSMVVDAKATIMRPELFGKVRISESREVECPISSSAGRETLKQWLIDNRQENGWELDAYLGSQTSVKPTGSNSCILRYRVMRWKEKSFLDN